MSRAPSVSTRAGRRAPALISVRALAVGLLAAAIVLGSATTGWAAGTVPVAPAKPTVATANAAIAVSFVAPGNGGSPITGYTATCTSSTGGVLGSAPGAGSPITVSSLTNAKLYTCTVHATNANGSSSESVASDVVIPGAPSAPATPTVTHGNGTISVAFVAPANNGSAITFFTGSCVSSDGGTPGTVDHASSPILVTGLTNGNTYTCTVTATNGNGTGAASPASAATVPATVPDAPVKPTTTRGNAQISVAFVAPADHGSAITGFTAACTSSDGGTAGSKSGAASPLVVIALTNGKTYTCTVLATNGEGNSAPSLASTATVPATVPGAPAQPTVVHGAASISVTFAAPASDGGAVVTSTTANCASSNGGTAGSNSGTVSPIVVSSLTNGKLYTCTVTASNAVGAGASSVASASATPAAVPAAPAAPTVTLGNTQISVAFVAPANNGSAIAGYTAACTSSDGGAAGSLGGAASPIVVTGLTNGKTYTCTVLATNGEGAGAASAASAAVVPATLPGAPAAPTLTHGNASISVAFSAPGSDGGHAITGYTAACTSSDGGAAGSLSGATSPIVVPSLTNGKTYTCTVLATSDVGSGPPSAASTSTVPATVPSVPAAPTVELGDGAISVTFAAPANGGSAITGYTASCSSSDGGTAGANTGAASPIVVSALDNGKTYTCTVHATNGEGSSGESAASAAVVPANVPFPPAQPVTTPGPTSISVAFVAPADGGSAITGYAVACSSSDGGAAGSNTGAATPIVVSSLSSGETYTCTVAASNVNGAGFASPASAATVVPATVPGQAAAPTVTHGNASISVAFVAPADGGSAITSFVATCTSSNGGAAGTNSGATSPIVVPALTNVKTYTCTVHAHNTVGNGAESLASGSAMPNVVPNAPPRPSVAAAARLITVRFGATTDPGTPITGYTASCASINGGAPGSQAGVASPIVVTGLTNGRRYTCSVTASNAQGPSAASAISGAVLVADAPVMTGLPTVTGIAVVQRTLTAHKGSWTGAPAPKFHYQWQRCNQFGTGCSNVGGSTSGTYLVTNADIGARLRLVVDATNDVKTVVGVSAVTAVILAVPGAISGPYFYNGTGVIAGAANVVGFATRGGTTWSVTATGDVTGPRFGPHGGTLVGIALTRPVVGMQVTPTGRGYWLFAADGGVFTFGDAHFFGSLGGTHLNAPIIAMQSTPSGRGYWLFAADGGVFTFGDAHFFGSTGGSRLAHPAVAMLATPSGNGYWVVTADGSVYAFGDAPYVRGIGSLGRTDIIGLISTGHGFRFVTRSLQLIAG